jgi:hypothetical protein
VGYEDFRTETMTDEEILELTGKRVDITWDDELLGRQEAGGIFIGAEDGYMNLDWGFGISLDAKGLTINVAE